MQLASINDENVKDFISSENLTVVMLGASWCGPCRSIKPAVQKISSENGDIKFAYCDIEDSIYFVSSLGVKAVPTFAIFRNGQVLQVRTTSRESDLREMISPYAL